MNRSVAKDPHRTRLGGNLLESLLPGLVRLHLLDVQRQRPELKLQYGISTNMDGANPFDDLIVHLRWVENRQQHTVTYFVQLKHAEKAGKTVSGHDLSGPISKKNKDFNLRRYFEFFKRLKNSNFQQNKNEDLLRKLSQEEYRFILFTTREILPKAKACRGVSRLEFPFEDIFSTNQGQIFSFGCTDPLVWNMLTGSPDEQRFRNEFLPKLRLFSGQAPVKVLKDVLARVFQNVVHIPYPQLLTRYMLHLQEWWDDDDVLCLTEEILDILETLKTYINTKLQQQFSFTNKCLNALKQRLECTQGSGYQTVFIIIPGIPQEMRCSAIREVLSESHPGRFVILTEDIIKEFSQFDHEILYNICVNDNLCSEVVLSIDTFTDYTRTFVNNILSKRKNNVFILSSRWDESMYSFIFSQSNNNNSWSERWTLDNFNFEEQQMLMNHCINFQGCEISLSELEKTWPSLRRDFGDAALCTLVTGKILSIGNPLPAINGQYLSRTVQHPISLKFSLLEIRSAKDHFMFSGLPEELLRKLRHPEASWQECSRAGGMKKLTADKEVKTKWTEVTRERPSDNYPDDGKSLRNPVDKKEYTKQLAKNVLFKESNLYAQESINQHWISYENNQLLWMRSEGSIECLQDYFEYKCNTCKQDPICYHTNSSDFSKWKDKTLVLTDRAGMGKTTYMKHMMNVNKKENPTRWVIPLDERHMKSNIPKNIEFCDVPKILSQCAGIADNISAYKFLRNCIDSGNITVLVDGVDEVCPALKISAISLLKILQQVLQKCDGSLWIASRTVLKEDLALILSKATFISLLPLSSHDQEQFLFKEWINSGDKCSDVSLTNFDVKGIVSVIQEMTSESDGYSICAVPMYLQMLAKAYTSEDFSNLLHKNRVNKASSFHKGALYRRFVEKTLQNCLFKAGISECDQFNLNITLKDMLDTHMKYAALECFHNHKLLGKHYNDIMNTVNELKSEVKREQIARYAIITHALDGRLKFSHHTLAEYLAALWLQENYYSLPQLAQSLYEARFGEINYFFDFLLAQSCSLHNAVLSENTVTLCSVLLQNKHLIDEEDSGGRTALHLAVMTRNSGAVRVLLNEGAKVSKQDKVLGWTPLRYLDAMIKISSEDTLKYDFKDELEIAELLLTSSANPKEAHYMFGDNNVFKTAISEDFPKVSECFIRKRGNLFLQKLSKKDYLHQAAEYGSLKVLSVLLRLGFNINATSEKYLKGTALHIAAKRGHIKYCEVLLCHGAHVNTEDKYGNTALHYAAQNNHKSVCEELLRHHANINAENKERKTPLHLAAREGNGFLCRDLLKYDANPDARDSYGQTARDEALRWKTNVDNYHSLPDIFAMWKEISFALSVGSLIMHIIFIIAFIILIVYFFVFSTTIRFIERGGLILMSLLSTTKNIALTKRDINQYIVS